MEDTVKAHLLRAQQELLNVAPGFTLRVAFDLWDVMYLQRASPQWNKVLVGLGWRAVEGSQTFGLEEFVERRPFDLHLCLCRHLNIAVDDMPEEPEEGDIVDDRTKAIFSPFLNPRFRVTIEFPSPPGNSLLFATPIMLSRLSLDEQRWVDRLRCYGEMKLVSGHFVQVTHLALCDPILLVIAIEDAAHMAIETNALSPEGNPLRLAQCPNNFQVVDAIWFPVRDILQGRVRIVPCMEDLQMRACIYQNWPFRTPKL